MTETGRPASLAAALAVLQTRLPEVRKGETAVVETQKGRYTYNYAGLPAVSRAILPLLGELGLSFVCRPTLNDSGVFVLAYGLMHDPSGECVGGQYPLPAGGTPQAIGSAISYGRRYCLAAITGMVAEDDDDAATASAQHEKPAAARASRARRTPPSTSDTTPAVDGERNADTVPPPMLRKLFALLADAGLSAREPALEYIAELVGRPIQSRNELSRSEVDLLIGGLEQLLTERAGEERQP
jgi:hypothetical protein